MTEEEQRPSKRRRMQQQGEEAAAENSPEQEQRAPHGDDPHAGEKRSSIEHILYVRWFGGQGQTKLNKLPLRLLENLDALEELPKELVESHYPEAQRLPEFMKFPNAAFVRFTPALECLALPGDVVRTEVRLVLCYDGWEFTILQQDVTHREPGPEQTLHLMTAEFMGSDPLMAALGLRVSLIAYPVVALKKAFLDELHERLLASPDTFKGML